MKSMYVTIALALSSLVIFAQSVSEIIKEGEQFENDGQYGMALVSYSRAIEDTADNVALFVRRSYILTKMKLYDAALSDLQSAELKDNKFSDIYTAKGNLLIEMDKIPEAVEEFDKAILLNKNDVSAYLNKSFLLAYLGNFTEAYLTFSLAQKIDMEEVNAYYQMAEFSGIIDLKDEGCQKVNLAVSKGDKDAENLMALFCSR